MTVGGCRQPSLVIPLGHRDHDGPARPSRRHPTVSWNVLLHFLIVKPVRRLGSQSRRRPLQPRALMGPFNEGEWAVLLRDIVEINEHFHELQILIVAVPQLAMLRRLLRMRKGVPELEVPQL